MRRFTFALPVMAGVLLASSFAACGGDSKDEPTETPTAGPTTLGLEPSPTRPPQQPRATPTATTGDSTALAVGGRRAASTYSPTVAEFRALPTTTIKGKTGVTLATLVEKAGKGDATIATIDGTAPGGMMSGAIRFPIDTISTNTIFVMDEAGHITIASDHIPENEWLIVVTNITLE